MTRRRCVRTWTVRLAALAATIGSAGGCSILIKAAKGELTPLGATAVDSQGVGAQATLLATEPDPSKAQDAFASLTSIYLYKCLDAPDLAPKDGKQDTRIKAGDALVSAMQVRATRYHPGEDPAAASLAQRATALQAEVNRKCGPKLSKHDAGGKLAAAVALTTDEGRQAQYDDNFASLDAALQVALNEPDAGRAVRRWTDKECPVGLPKADCLPHALEVLHEQGRWDVIVNEFVRRDAATTLTRLTERVGLQVVVERTQQALLVPDDESRPTSREAMDALTDYLRTHDAWGGCDANAAAYAAKVAGDDWQAAQWAVQNVVADRCVGLADAVVQALASDHWMVREKAAWAIGELDLRVAKRHIKRLQWDDPAFVDGCYCYPVRQAAKIAFNKLEINAS